MTTQLLTARRLTATAPSHSPTQRGRLKLPVINIIHTTRPGHHPRRPRNQLDFEIGTLLVDTDYAAIARGFGCHGEIVERTEEVAAALARACASGLPAVLDCRTRFVLHPAGPAFGSMNRYGFDALTRVAATPP